LEALHACVNHHVTHVVTTLDEAFVLSGKSIEKQPNHIFLQYHIASTMFGSTTNFITIDNSHQCMANFKPILQLGIN
jgi:hypothetical protein